MRILGVIYIKVIFIYITECLIGPLCFCGARLAETLRSNDAHSGAIDHYIVTEIVIPTAIDHHGFAVDIHDQVGFRRNAVLGIIRVYNINGTICRSGNVMNVVIPNHNSHRML